MDNLTEFAKLLKERENQTVPSMIVGKVVSSNPIQIQVNEFITLETEDLIFSKSAYIFEGDEEVILMPTQDGQIYFVLDKVVRL